MDTERPPPARRVRDRIFFPLLLCLVLACQRAVPAAEPHRPGGRQQAGQQAAPRFAAATGRAPTAGITSAATSTRDSASTPAVLPDDARRQLTLVVPFAANGPTDTVARALAGALGQQLGRTVLVENLPGAGGTVGAAAVAAAAPDGSRLLLHHVGMATAPVLYRSLPYDPQRDFDPIGRIADVPMTLVARPGWPVTDAQAAVRYIRRNQGTLVLAYAGLGAASHLCGLLLSMSLGVDLIQVPYRGTAPALQDLQEGRADLMCDQTTNTGSAIRDRRILPLAVTSARRLALMPLLPTMAEAGVRGLELAIWHGLFAPAGTPAAVVARLSQALQAALEAPAFVRHMDEMQVVIADRAQATPTALAALLAAEIVRWTPVLRKAGQYAD